MTVGQKFESIRHFAFSEHLGRVVAVKNYVVYDHELRSHMLRMLYGKLDNIVSEHDRRTVLGLVHVYLDGKPRQLHSYDNWKATTDELLKNHDHYSADMRQILREISEMLETKHEPCQQ